MIRSIRYAVPFHFFVTLTAMAAQPDSTNRDLYGTLKRDMRKCLSPLCGGYWFTPVNGVSKAVYVSGLVSPYVLDDQDLPRLLVRGQLTLPEPQFQTRRLQIEAVYVAKTSAPAAPDLDYSISYPRIPPHNCVVAPCPNILAQRLNLETIREFDRFEFEGFEASLTTAVLEKMALSPDVIEAGTFVKGTVKFPGGYETIYRVNALYERMDELN